MKKFLLFLALLLVVASLAWSQTAPSLYYQFTNPTPLAPVSGSSITNDGGGLYTITASDVGTALTWPSNEASYMFGPSLTGTNVTIQFLWKSNYETARGQNTRIFSWGAGANSVGVYFEYPNIIFATNQNDTEFPLTGINNMSWDQLMNGQWHHLAFVFAGSTKQVWINGQRLFSVAASPTTITGTFTLNSGVSYIKAKGSIDELAFYTTAIPPRQIYQNYLDFQAGNHYTTALAPALVYGPDSVGTLDTNEFTLDIPRQYQLMRYPSPRYKPGHTMNRNFNWQDPYYQAGQFQPDVPNATVLAQNGVLIQSELAKNWNYYFFVMLSDNSYFNQQMISTANANPTWKFQTITFRSRYGSPTRITSQSNPNADYLQNSFGQYLDAQGNIITSNKIWRPTAPTADYNADGDGALSAFNTLFLTFNDTLNMINENGEIFPHPTDAALAKDPQVVSAKNASGLSYGQFLGRKFMENETLSYRNRFMVGRNSTAKFTEYAIDGGPIDRFNYSEARKVNSQINGYYYSTPDVYVRWPDNWRYWVSSWHGWQWIVQSRATELAVGDKLYSPFVSAGWDATESVNVRPAQYMGLLKALQGSGAEFFYPGFFSLEAPWPDSKNWIWQAAQPSYTQALLSKVPTYLYSADLMAGDIPDSYVTPVNPGYNFYTGRSNTIVTVRKVTGQEKYLISGTLQPISNYGGTALEDTVTITLAGQALKINIRRQGSVYVYDKTTTPATFYQLDSWHEYKHPSRWSTDFYFDAEVTDDGTGTITTATSGPDYTAFSTSYKGTGQYAFTPRDTATYWLYVRAKSSTSQEMAVNVGAVFDTICVGSSSYAWYRFDDDSSKISYSFNSLNYVLNISSGTIEVDQIVLSKDSALYAVSYYDDCDTTSPPPICTWVLGNWSAWGTTCITGYIYRTRTVTSSIPSCTPAGTMPATTDSTVCVCGWITSNWSAFGNCVGGYQYRTRTATSSLTGCVPSAPVPSLIDSVACSCSWVVGPWGAYSACNGVYQVRYRTVVSSVTGCVPIPAQPATSDTLSCTIPPPICYWSAGAWSAWSNCVSDTQYRTRTVTSTISGCTPTAVKPDTIEYQTCSSTIPVPTDLIVVSKRWWSVRIEWKYSPNPTLFQTELITGTSVSKQNYSGSTRRVYRILRNRTAYTFKIRALVGNDFSPWVQIGFITTN